jgi:hypothetical protein
MLDRKFKLFRLFGFEVGLDPSWIVLSILVAYSLSTGYFPFKLALSFVVTGAIPAYSMRCANGLVTDGSNKLEVLDACDEPMKKYGDEVKIGETGLNTGEDEK